MVLLKVPFLVKKNKVGTLSKVPLLVALWMYDYNGCTPEVQASNLTMRAFYTIVY